MKVLIHGSGTVDLSNQDFVASGGEGSIYAKGSLAYKVYNDPTHMLPVGKITELGLIQDPNVIKPEQVLLDQKGKTPIGYTMRYVSDVIPLCQTFTPAFRDRNGIQHSTMLALVQKLQGLVDHVHAAKVLMVDLNEMNFLVSNVFDQVYAIDVDSYQTAHYPATAIMPSVRDWTVKHNQFTEGSDWFSFACVSFQMFTGIHPYKGRHPSVSGLDERMRQNISVFDPSVTTPKVVYPITVIPQGYRDWLKAVLQDGKRIHPPIDPSGGVILVTPVFRNITSQDSLDIQVFKKYAEEIVGYFEWGTQQVAIGCKNIFVNSQPSSLPNAQVVVGSIPQTGTSVLGWLNQGKVHLWDATHSKTIPVDVQASGIMGYDGDIYVQSDNHVLRLDLLEVGSQIIASTRIATNVMSRATKLFPGLVYQNMLGSCYLTVYHNHGSYQIRVPDLDGARIVDAKHDHRVIMLNVFRKGKYDRVVLEISSDYQTYQVRQTASDIQTIGLNFITLVNVVYACINEDEDLEISALGNPKTRVVKSSILGSDMHLVRVQGRVGFMKGDTVFTMRLK